MTSPAPGTRGRLLLADDEAIVRASLSRLLAQRGFTCTCVATGTEALAQIRQADFDALLADIQMPGNDGLNLVECIPQLAAGLPIVLLTGHPTVETAARSVRLSVVAYLTKPPDLDELTTILDEAIAAYRGFRAAQAGRQRLQAWEQELEQILAHRKAPQSLPGGPMGSFLRLTLRQVILVLSDLERATATLEEGGTESAALQRVDHEAALRRAVDVLRQTKQSFKSKELADLRKQLETLLAQADPADSTASEPAASG